MEYHIPHHRAFLYGVTGGAGNVGYNALILAEQGIHQGTFAHIGATDDGGGNTLTDELSRFKRGKQMGKICADIFQPL